jgi:hypothetical protein
MDFGRWHEAVLKREKGFERSRIGRQQGQCDRESVGMEPIDKHRSNPKPLAFTLGLHSGHKLAERSQSQWVGDKSP